MQVNHHRIQLLIPFTEHVFLRSYQFFCKLIHHKRTVTARSESFQGTLVVVLSQEDCFEQIKNLWHLEEPQSVFLYVALAKRGNFYQEGEKKEQS